MVVTAAGRTSRRRELKDMKAPSAMAVRVAAPEISTSVRELQQLKASMPMVARCAGKVTSQREVQVKALAGISTRSSGRWKYGQATRAHL